MSERLVPVQECRGRGKPPQSGPHEPHHWLRRVGPIHRWRWRYCPGVEEDYGSGCDCTELCEMGPTCPGGMLAGLEGSGCWRTGADS